MVAVVALCPRVKRIVYFFQSCVIDMRVDLGRGNAGVTQHLLNLSQVSPPGKQMRGKTMS